ncbi:hypothetical protein, partial [Staphylococcus epidermidis]
EQGNTEQNNQNAEPSAPGTTDQAGATVKPGTTPNQDAEVKPNTDQTATGTQGATGDQNAEQGNTEQNN